MRDWDPLLSIVAMLLVECKQSTFLFCLLPLPINVGIALDHKVTWKIV